MLTATIPANRDEEWMLYLADCCLRSSQEALDRSRSWWVRLTGQHAVWLEQATYWNRQEMNWRQVAQDVRRSQERRLAAEREA